MSEINLYPEMNERIADLLLGCEDNPMCLYAGAYIKDLQSRLKQLASNAGQSLGEVKQYYSRMAGETYGIEADKRVMGGMPVIKGTRIPVSLIIGCLKDEMVFEEISKEYYLLCEDIKNALKYVVEILDYPYE